jgi:hypothetical protein
MNKNELNFNLLITSNSDLNVISYIFASSVNDSDIQNQLIPLPPI